MDALAAERRGAGPRLVLLHGFTQTGRLWGPFGNRLAERHELLAVDLPGHGGSSAVDADLTRTAALVVAAAGEGPYDLLGYSLGARVALHVALEAPPGLRRLVVIGATAGIADPTARAARRSRDEELADRLERSGDVAGFLDRWLANPMFAGLPPEASGRSERARNTAAGLASSLRRAGTGTQEPLEAPLGAVPTPTLVVAGATDHRFVAAGRRLVAALPAATLSLVPGAGHAAHLEQPALAARTVGSWLAG